jgi:hypothetical protein
MGFPADFREGITAVVVGCESVDPAPGADAGSEGGQTKVGQASLLLSALRSRLGRQDACRAHDSARLRSAGTRILPLSSANRHYWIAQILKLSKVTP